MTQAIMNLPSSSTEICLDNMPGHSGCVTPIAAWHRAPRARIVSPLLPDCVAPRTRLARAVL